MKYQQDKHYSENATKFIKAFDAYLDYYFTKFNSPYRKNRNNPNQVLASAKWNGLELTITLNSLSYCYSLTTEMSLPSSNLGKQKLQHLIDSNDFNFYNKNGLLTFCQIEVFDDCFELGYDIAPGYQPMHFLEKSIAAFHALWSYLKFGTIVYQAEAFIYKKASWEEFEVPEYSGAYWPILIPISDYFLKFSERQYNLLDPSTFFVFDKNGVFKGLDIIAPPSAIVLSKKDYTIKFLRGLKPIVYENSYHEFPEDEIWDKELEYLSNLEDLDVEQVKEFYSHPLPY